MELEESSIPAHCRSPEPDDVGPPDCVLFAMAARNESRSAGPLSVLALPAKVAAENEDAGDSAAKTDTNAETACICPANLRALTDDDSSIATHIRRRLHAVEGDGEGIGDELALAEGELLIEGTADDEALDEGDDVDDGLGIGELVGVRVGVGVAVFVVEADGDGMFDGVDDCDIVGVGVDDSEIVGVGVIDGVLVAVALGVGVYDCPRHLLPHARTTSSTKSSATSPPKLPAYRRSFSEIDSSCSPPLTLLPMRTVTTTLSPGETSSARGEAVSTPSDSKIVRPTVFEPGA